MSKTRFPILGVVVIGLCGVGGYSMGRTARGDAYRAEISRESAVIVDRPSPRDRRTEEDPVAGFRGLLEAGSRETDVWKVISRLPGAAIPEALRRVAEARGAAASGTEETKRLDEIEAALYFHWAESDPQAALAAAVAIPETHEMMAGIRRENLLKSVMAAWMRTDPNAAYRAVKDDEKLEYYGRDQLVRTWTPANVFENLELYPETQDLLLGWYCLGTATDPASRNAMLAALKEQPEMAHRDWGYQLLFRGWGQTDFHAAMTEAQAQQLPKIVKQLVKDNISHNPALALPWAVKNNLPPDGKSWEEGYQFWLRTDGPGARKWLAEQAPAWESSGHTDVVAGFLAKEYGLSIATQHAATQEAARKRLSDFMEKWQTKDPEAAGNWLETAPPPIREIFAGEGDPER